MLSRVIKPYGGPSQDFSVGKLEPGGDSTEQNAVFFLSFSKWGNRSSEVKRREARRLERVMTSEDAVLWIWQGSEALMKVGYLWS